MDFDNFMDFAKPVGVILLALALVIGGAYLIDKAGQRRNVELAQKMPERGADTFKLLAYYEDIPGFNLYLVKVEGKKIVVVVRGNNTSVAVLPEERR